MQNIMPFLWFDSEAEEAANYYVSIFSNSKLLSIGRYTEEGAAPTGKPAGSVMLVEFELNGMKFSAINGGPVYRINPAISFVVKCDSQEELDHLWEALSFYPAEEQCGWCRDKFGVSWQIIPALLDRLMSSGDPARSGRVMQAILQMKKLDLRQLEAAYNG